MVSTPNEGRSKKNICLFWWKYFLFFPPVRFIKKFVTHSRHTFCNHIFNPQPLSLTISEHLYYYDDESNRIERKHIFPIHKGIIVKKIIQTKYMLQLIDKKKPFRRFSICSESFNKSVYFKIRNGTHNNQKEKTPPPEEYTLHVCDVPIMSGCWIYWKYRPRNDFLVVASLHNFYYITRIPQKKTGSKKKRRRRRRRKY